MTPSVDWTVIDALRTYSTEELDLVRELVASFETSIAQQVPELELAVERGDADTTRFIAHKLRGTCGHVGARRMEFLCERLEQLGRAGVTIGASELIEDLRSEFMRVRIALNGSGAETRLDGPESPAS
jgi:HPt (histidine-containing phosphotransfer) domain-containing protein